MHVRSSGGCAAGDISPVPAGAGVLVSVILAAYNEAETIGDVVRGVRRTTPNLSEILVIDDGSADRTAVVAREAGARVIRHARNRGKGEALRTGCRAASGDVLLFLDADGQDDVNEIPLLLAALEPGVAMAIGSRFAGKLVDGAITPLNRLGNRLLTGMFNRLYGSKISDTQAGFRAVRKNSIDPDALRAHAYEIETEMLIHVMRRGGRVVEVPVTRYPRAAGMTSFLPLYHGMRIFRAMLVGRLRRPPRPWVAL
jgi:glycosyltransferase involved in cell wall biosynthesis